MTRINKVKGAKRIGELEGPGGGACGSGIVDRREAGVEEDGGGA